MHVLSANEWSRVPNPRLFAVVNNFHIEKFLREFSSGSVSSLNISASYSTYQKKRSIGYLQHKTLLKTIMYRNTQNKIYRNEA